MHRLTQLLLQFVRPATERDPVEFVLRWRGLMLALWHHPDGRKGVYALFSYLASQLEAPPERLAAAGALIHEEVRTMGKSIAEQCREEGLRKGLSIADQCREEGLQKGLRQGKAEGKAEGRAELLLRQIKARFGSASAEAERRIRDASTDLLDAWGVRILTATRLEDLFA